MIYEKIKRLAAEEGISIAALEKKLNIGNGTIRKWNEASPTFENVFKVAKHFDVSIDYFAELATVQNHANLHFVNACSQTE